MGKWTRRAFITAGVITGGAVVVGVAIRPGNRSDKVKHLIAKDGETVFNIWLKIAPDNMITLYVPHSEMGQGIHTTLGMMVAEELDANWDQIKVLEAPADKEYANHVIAKGFIVGDKNIPAFLDETVDGVFLTAVKSMNLQITGGSGSVRFTGRSGISIAGATMKQLLKQAAAQDWEVDIKELRTENSMITHEASKQSATYASFATSAADLSVSEDIVLKSFDDYKIVGTYIPRIDIPSKVNGTAKFGLDVTLDGMKYATLQAAPVFGNEVKAYDKEAIQQMPGVQKIVNLKSALAVIADGYWQAKMALNKANIEWTVNENNQVNQEGIFDQYTTDLEKAINKDDLEDDIEIGDVESNKEDILLQFDAKYQIPYLAHATMEPMNCTAVVSKEQCEIWCGSQNPLGYRADIAEALDFDMDQVKVNNHFMGGGFGRRSESDMAIQAAKIANEVTYPVKLIWSREEDIRQDYYREANVSWFNASLDHAGMPKTWTNRFLFKHHPPEASQIPYAIDHQLIQYAESPTHIPWGNWRSVDHSMHGFFTESFIDELANEVGKDPYEYRRDLLEQKPRFLKVLIVKLPLPVPVTIQPPPRTFRP